jgi:hypothetical protein
LSLANQYWQIYIVAIRTLIAFFSKSNAVTIYVSKFGEQHLDIFALIIFFIICIARLILLLKTLKKEKIDKNIES